MKEGDVVLVVFPGEVKKRPALLLKQFPKYGDYLTCAISSQLHQYDHELGWILDEGHPDYSGSGLQLPSVFRLDVIARFSVNEIVGVIGNISTTEHRNLLQKFADFLLN